MRTIFRLGLSLLAIVGLALGSPVSAEGEKLERFLDSLHVEEHWIAGVIVDWKTGDPTGQPILDSGKHTHCSQFTASASDRLGIYLLRPPEHKGTLLANAQFDWLSSDEGKAKGWAPVTDGASAQGLANRGSLVVAVYKNPDPRKSGHIAIIRPSAKDDATIETEGPQVTQAGGTNMSSGTLKHGFGNHPGAFRNREISFFAHAIVFPLEVK